jgi:hypothetical protein
MSQTSNDSASNLLDIESVAAPSHTLLLTNVAHRPRLAAPEHLDNCTTATSTPQLAEPASPQQTTSTLSASRRHEDSDTKLRFDNTNHSTDTNSNESHRQAIFTLDDTINDAENRNSHVSGVLEPSPRNALSSHASGIVRNNSITTLLGILHVWCLTICCKLYYYFFIISGNITVVISMNNNIDCCHAAADLMLSKCS